MSYKKIDDAFILANQLGLIAKFQEWLRDEPSASGHRGCHVREPQPLTGCKTDTDEG